MHMYNTTIKYLSKSGSALFTMYQCTIELCYCCKGFFFNVFLFSPRKMIVLVSKSPVHFSKLPKLRLFWLPTSKVNAFKLQNLERGENESENILSKWKTGKFRTIFSNVHGVWKSQKKSHSTLRAKRATFRFWVDKSWLKMPKMVHFGEFLKTWSLRSNSVTRQVNFDRTKIGGKYQNSKIQMLHFE
mgnify:FL=1